VTKKILLIFAVFILIVLFANNMHALLLELLGTESFYDRPPWYEVDEWEADVCSKWGGTDFAGQAVTTAGRKFSWAEMTATVQASKFKTKENYFVYQVGWYLDSFGEQTDYEIKLVSESNQDIFYLVDSGTLSPESGKIGYEAYNLTENFDIVRFTYTGGAISIPIIQVK